MLQASLAGGAQPSASAGSSSSQSSTLLSRQSHYGGSRGDEQSAPGCRLITWLRTSARTITSELRPVSALTTTELRRELEAAVARRGEASPLLTGISVSDAWVSDATESSACCVRVDRGERCLWATDGPIGCLKFPRKSHRFWAHWVSVRNRPRGQLQAPREFWSVSRRLGETQLRGVRDNVITHPQPITLTVMGPELEPGRLAQQTLTQVVAP